MVSVGRQMNSRAAIFRLPDEIISEITVFYTYLVSVQENDHEAKAASGTASHSGSATDIFPTRAVLAM